MMRLQDLHVGQHVRVTDWMERYNGIEGTVVLLPVNGTSYVELQVTHIPPITGALDVYMGGQLHCWAKELSPADTHPEIAQDYNK